MLPRAIGLTEGSYIPFITVGTTAQLQIKVPTRGTTTWDEVMRTDTFVKIAEHDHTGSSGKGIQLATGAIAADAITGAKIRLDNDEYLRGRNQANSANLNLIRANTSDLIDFGVTISDDAFTLGDNADGTKALVVSLGGATTGKKMTLTSSHTDNRTLTLPDATDTLVGKATTDTLTNKTLTSAVINSPTTFDVSDAVFSIQDNGDATKEVRFEASGITTGTIRTLTVQDSSDTLVGRATTDTLTNKTLTSPTINTPVIASPSTFDVSDAVFSIQDNGDATKEIRFEASGISTGTIRTLTVQDSSDTLVGRATTDTLTNKTLTSPVLTTPQINDTSADHQYVFAVSELTADRTVTLPLLTGNDTFTFNAFAATLTNKTIDSDNNTITNIVNADVKAAAAIAVNKLAAATASRALESDGSGFITAATTTATELGYVNGVTSAIQTQIDTKLPTTITTTGDVIYSSSGTTAARLGIGSAGEVLKVASGIPSWAANTAANLVVQSKSGAYTVDTGDDIILCDSGSAFTVTLYTAVGNSGSEITVTKTTSDFNAVTIDGNASETINGVTTTTINTQWESVRLLSDGSNWIEMDRKIVSVWEDFTPTGDWSANTTYSGKKRRVGDSLEFQVLVELSGAPTGTFTVNHPDSLSADTAKINGAGPQVVLGVAYIKDAGTPSNSTSGTVNEHTDNNTKIFVIPDGANSVDATTPFTFASGDKVVVHYMVPISGWKA